MLASLGSRFFTHGVHAGEPAAAVDTTPGCGNAHTMRQICNEASLPLWITHFRHNPGAMFLAERGVTVVTQGWLLFFSWISVFTVLVTGIVLNATTASARTRTDSRARPRRQKPVPHHAQAPQQPQTPQPSAPQHQQNSGYSGYPDFADSSLQASQPGQPIQPGQQQPHLPHQSVQKQQSSTAWMPNILLGVACLFLIAAAITFASVTGSPIVRAVAIGVVAALSYVAGLVIHALSARLKPVGFALVALGIALLPIAAGLLGASDSIPGSVAWFAASLVGVIAYVLAAILLKSETIMWFGLLFVGSLVLSIVNFAALPPVAFFYGLMATATVFALVGALARNRLPKRFVRPHMLLGEILAPASAVACLFVQPFPVTYQWAILFGLLTVFYVLSASLNRWGWQAIVARVTGALTIALTANAVTKLVSDTDDAIRFATGLAFLVVGLWHVVEALIRRANTAFRLTAHIVTTACFMVGTAVTGFRIESTDGRLYIPAGIIFALLAAMHLVFAVTTDTPLQRALGYGSAVMFAVSLACVVAYFIGGDKSAVVICYVIAVGVSVIADALFTGWIVSPRGRSRRRLRISSPFYTAIFPASAFAPAFLALFYGMQAWHLVVLFVLVLVLVGLAFLVRSGLFTLSTVPLLFAFSFGVDAVIAGSRDSWRWIFSRPLSLTFFALLAAGLMIVYARRYARGRYRRAQYAAIASLIVTGLGAINVLTIALAPNFPYATLFVSATAIDLVALLVGFDVARRLTRPEHQRRVEVAKSEHAKRAQNGLVAQFKPSPAPVFVILYAAAVCVHAVGAVVPKFEEWYFFTIVSVLATAVIVYVTHVMRVQWFILATMVTVPTFARSVTSPFLEGVNHFVLANIIAWAILYAVHWVQVLVKRKALASLVAATLILLGALLPAAFINSSAVPIPSFARVVVGLILLAVAATVMTAVRVSRHRAVFFEIASYVGALGLAVSFSGLVRWNFYVPLHILALTALVWAWVYGSRGGFPWLASRRVGTQVRLYLTFGIMTFIGLLVAFIAGGFYTAVFLSWLVLFLIMGALTNRPVLVWCSVGTLALSAVWLLRDVVWLVLVVLALIIIGVVVWMLLRGNRKPVDDARADQPGQPFGAAQDRQHAQPPQAPRRDVPLPPQAPQPPQVQRQQPPQREANRQQPPQTREPFNTPPQAPQHQADNGRPAPEGWDSSDRFRPPNS